MQYPGRFSGLPEYAFPRLRRLLSGCAPGGPEISMSIGEPVHPIPGFVGEIIAKHAEEFRRYPPNEGTPELRGAISGWISRRYGVAADPDTRIVPLNGTREGLFNAALALSPETVGGSRPAVLMPNPFYQCYGTAALAVGADPVMVPARPENGFLPDFSALSPDTLDRTTVCYICSPSNPQGTVAGPDYWSGLIDLAERHDFRIFADECYSEIYRGTPPPGILQTLVEKGADPDRVVAFHSLSKRSNAAGLRSGFAVSGPGNITAIRALRAYSGAPLPLPLQHAATALWNDEDHVIRNRALYAEKFTIADRVLSGLPGFRLPNAGFFLWINTGDGERMVREIYTARGVKTLPGAYLARNAADGSNPGADYIRVALVAPEDEIERGLTAIAEVVGSRPPAEKGD